MDKNNFGKKLKLLRSKLGLTQEQLANKLKISSSTIGMYEQNRREPDNKTLLRLCEILETTGDYLLGAEDFKIARNLDINSIISNFLNFFEQQPNLMFNGKPINEIDKEKIANAIRVAATIAITNFNEKKQNSI
jgi:transcriptional regulator with XRE-family HTH domain